MPVELDLLLFVKETQLQHGLRAEDFARYHSYLSNRVATLRRQLNLSNDKKKFLHREVSANTANDPRHLMLLALYSERCWAESESMVEIIANEKRREQREGGKTTRAGGVPPKELSRKRLNKAVVWAGKLVAVANTAASPRTKVEANAYLAEAEGRCALSHGRFAEAAEFFKVAREHHASLQTCSNESQWPIVLSKIGELEDRVVYSMQCAGQDPSTYRPSQGAGLAKQYAVTVQWNNRTLNIFSVKVKDTLREVQRWDWAAAKVKALEGTGPVHIGLQNKALDVIDRCIGLYNDALGHARQDLRSASDGQRQELQLLVHYLSYHVAWCALERTRFMISVFERRYWSTVEALRSKSVTSSSTASPEKRVIKKPAGAAREFAPSQYASPLEVSRLYDQALETIAEMSLLPGVAGRDDVETWESECQAGKLFFAAEAWHCTGDCPTAMAQYQQAKSIIQKAPTSTMLESLTECIDRAIVSLTAEQVLKSAAAPKVQSSKYLVDSLGECAIATNVAKLPPDYQAVACKPVFVDIAMTYIEYPQTASQQEEQQRSITPPPSAGHGGAGANHADPSTNAEGNQKKGWGWGSWGWGKGGK